MFAKELLDHAWRAHPSFLPTAQEVLAFDAFMEALTPVLLQRHVRLMVLALLMETASGSRIF